MVYNDIYTSAGGSYHILSIPIAMDTNRPPSDLNEELCLAIIGAVADQTAVEVTIFDLVLYEYIDIDAVAQLMSQPTGQWTLSFALGENTVTIRDDGRILLDGIIQETIDI